MSENLFEIKARMCKGINDCKDCPIYEAKQLLQSCPNFLFANPIVAEEILLKWAAENPLPKPKTMQEKFYEMFPDAPEDDDKAPVICPHNLGWDNNKHCDTIECKDCWNQPYEGE